MTANEKFLYFIPSTFLIGLGTNSTNFFSSIFSRKYAIANADSIKIKLINKNNNGLSGLEKDAKI